MRDLSNSSFNRSNERLNKSEISGIPRPDKGQMRTISGPLSSSSQQPSRKRESIEQF